MTEAEKVDLSSFARLPGTSGALHTLKHNDAFAVIAADGSIHGRAEHGDTGAPADGLFVDDTRLVSHYVFGLGANAPEFRHAEMDENNGVVLHIEQTNPTMKDADGKLLQPEDVLIHRALFLWDGVLYEKMEIYNKTDAAIKLPVRFEFNADFHDMFEVRGAQRRERGTYHPVRAEGGAVHYAYTGLDEAERRSVFALSEDPARLDDNCAELTLFIPESEHHMLYFRAGKDTGDTRPGKALYDVLLNTAIDFYDDMKRGWAEVSTRNADFNRWMARNRDDLALLVTKLHTGWYPYAGIPWFSTVFGRDGIITALQLLWQNPDIARGVLAHLAKKQATETDPFYDAEPGKILHETRNGEMAACRETALATYYGSIDSTPLFILLAGEYHRRTGDIEFIREIWPNIVQALGWIDNHGDRDGDGFVEYERASATGLVNQGWKDSKDSISHADGALAEGPIALCEVQGYVYAGKKSAALMARALGHSELADGLEREADALFKAFNAAFWLDDLGTYALALDGHKKPCAVKSSNPGHLLFCGIVPTDRAAKLAATLMSPEMFSGWGIRTLGTAEKRYEPVKSPEGYHNGTVWPHDTALIAYGFLKYGMEDEAARLLTALFRAARHFAHMRLPELFAGFDMAENGAPQPYPTSCIPQAWAAGAESLMLASTLGIKIDGIRKTVTVEKPGLPDDVSSLTVRNLRVAGGAVGLKFSRDDNGAVSATLLSKPDDVVVVLKND